MGVVAGLVAISAFFYGIGWYVYVNNRRLRHRQWDSFWPWAIPTSFFPALFAMWKLLSGDWPPAIIGGTVCIIATTIQILVFRRLTSPCNADE